MRVLVCGGREFRDRNRVFAVLDALTPPVSTVIHGAARGADALADEWARARGVPVERFPADWTRHERAAGPLRNARMLTEGRPDRIVAFPGGRGTADMLARGRLARIMVTEG